MVSGCQLHTHMPRSVQSHAVGSMSDCEVNMFISVSCYVSCIHQTYHDSSTSDLICYTLSLQLVHHYMPVDWARYVLTCVRLTSNVTGCHRRPKQKLPVGYTPPSLQRMSYLWLVLSCWPSSIFHRRVWYRMLSLRYVCILHSGIILTPRLPLCQILFLLRPPLLS